MSHEAQPQRSAEQEGMCLRLLQGPVQGGNGPPQGRRKAQAEAATAPPQHAKGMAICTSSRNKGSFLFLLENLLW